MGIDKGNWAATATSSELVAANEDRGSLIVQLTSAGDPTSLGIGEDAVFGDGVQLISAGDFVEIKGHQARLAVNGICDTGNSSSGGYQES